MAGGRAGEWVAGRLSGVVAGFVLHLPNSLMLQDCACEKTAEAAISAQRSIIFKDPDEGLDVIIGTCKL